MEGGFYIGQKSGKASTEGTKKTDKIASDWQTAASLPCSYDLKNEYGLKLKAGTKYYMMLYCKDNSGKMYYGKEFSFTTKKAMEYTDVKVKSVTADNAVITATLLNQTGAKLTSGGFIIGTKAGTAMKNVTKTDAVTGKWQTAKSVPCSFDLRDEYGIKLNADTTYYVQLFCEDSSGNRYTSKGICFKTGKAESVGSAPFHYNGGGESAKFDMPESSCYVNSYAMIFQMLGNNKASPTAIYKFNGNTVYCKGTTAIAEHFGFKATRADKLSEYSGFKDLNSEKQEKMLKKALGKNGVCNLNVFSGQSGNQIHMAMAYMKDGELLVRDPGYSEKNGCDISYSKFLSQVQRDMDKSAYIYNFWIFSVK